MRKISGSSFSVVSRKKIRDDKKIGKVLSFRKYSLGDDGEEMGLGLYENNRMFLFNDTI